PMYGELFDLCIAGDRDVVRLRLVRAFFKLCFTERRLAWRHEDDVVGKQRDALRRVVRLRCLHPCAHERTDRASVIVGRSGAAAWRNGGFICWAHGNREHATTNNDRAFSLLTHGITTHVTTPSNEGAHATKSPRSSNDDQIDEPRVRSRRDHTEALHRR